MALAEETKRVVDQFDFSSDDLNRHVNEFLKQMGKSQARALTFSLVA
jgi:hexokinase